jgi:hypothetical protein
VLAGFFVDEFTNELSEKFKTLLAKKTVPTIGGKITTKEPEVPIKK